MFSWFLEWKTLLICLLPLQTILLLPPLASQIRYFLRSVIISNFSLPEFSTQVILFTFNTMSVHRTPIYIYMYTYIYIYICICIYTYVYICVKLILSLNYNPDFQLFAKCYHLDQFAKTRDIREAGSILGWGDLLEKGMD